MARLNLWILCPALIMILSIVTEGRPCRRRKCWRHDNIGHSNGDSNIGFPEFHLEGYQFCGPFTRVNARVARGDRGINALDKACLQHDLAYNRAKNKKDVFLADRDLVMRAKILQDSDQLSEQEEEDVNTVLGIILGKMLLEKILGRPVMPNNLE